MIVHKYGKSRKKTALTLKTNAMPMANKAKNSISKMVTGKNGKTKLPAIVKAMQTSVISIENCTEQNRTCEITKLSRANATFRTRVVLLKIACSPTEHMSEKKPHGIKPVKRYRPKVVIPEGSPAGAWAPNSTPKTNVYIAIWASGLSIDHDQPMTDRRYLLRSSRNVKFHSKLRELAISLSCCIELQLTITSLR